MPENITAAILLSKSPEAIRAYLQLHASSNGSTYQALKELIESYLQARGVWDRDGALKAQGSSGSGRRGRQHDSDDMEVSAFGAKGKGKGKKGSKGKGSTGTTPPDVTCFHCGRKGHYKSDCWFLESESTKGNNKGKGKGHKGKGKGDEGK